MNQVPSEVSLSPATLMATLCGNPQDGGKPLPLTADSLSNEEHYAVLSSIFSLVGKKRTCLFGRFLSSLVWSYYDVLGRGCDVSLNNPRHFSPAGTSSVQKPTEGTISSSVQASTNDLTPAHTPSLFGCMCRYPRRHLLFDASSAPYPRLQDRVQSHGEWIAPNC